MLPISIKNEGRKKKKKREGNRGREKIGKRKEKKKDSNVKTTALLFRISNGIHIQNSQRH